MLSGAILHPFFGDWSQCEELSDIELPIRKFEFFKFSNGWRYRWRLLMCPMSCHYVWHMFIACCWHELISKLGLAIGLFGTFLANS